MLRFQHLTRTDTHWVFSAFFTRKVSPFSSFCGCYLYNSVELIGGVFRSGFKFKLLYLLLFSSSLFSLQLQFRFFRQQAPVSSPDSGPQLQYSSAAPSTAPPSTAAVTFQQPAGNPAAYSSTAHPAAAAAPGHPASPGSPPDRPGGASPGSPSSGPAPPFFLPGSSPTGPGKRTALGLWHPVRWRCPASSPPSPSPASPRCTDLFSLSIRPTACAGLPLSRSHGLAAAPHATRLGAQEAPPSQSAAHQRRAQRPVGSHQERWENTSFCAPNCPGHQGYRVSSCPLQAFSCGKWRSSGSRRPNTSAWATTWPPSSRAASPWSTPTPRMSPSSTKEIGWSDGGKKEKEAVLATEGKYLQVPLSRIQPPLIKDSQFSCQAFVPHQKAVCLWFVFGEYLHVVCVCF